MTNFLELHSDTTTSEPQRNPCPRKSSSDTKPKEIEIGQFQQTALTSQASPVLRRSITRMISFPKIFSLNILHIEHNFVEIHDFGDLVVRERCNNTPSFQPTISCHLEIPLLLRGAPWLPVSQQEFVIMPRFYPACPIFLYDN